MKTTLELPDALFLEAKAIALRRRTTFKAIVEQALRREIQATPTLTPEQCEYMEVGPLGIIRLKKTGSPMTPETYRERVERIEREDDERYLNPQAE